MSLSKDKASLFSTGGGTSGVGGKPKTVQPKPAGVPAPAAVAAAPAPVIRTRAGAVPALSADAKARKIAEAKDCSNKGTKSLETSVTTETCYGYHVCLMLAVVYALPQIFQWSPDYVLAAPYFERAGECYKIAGEFHLAKLMFVQAAEIHDKLGANSAGALTYLKSAQISQVLYCITLFSRHRSSNYT